MQQIADWLNKLGMSEYAQRFAENDIDFAILGDLTDQDLEKIGVASLGHRRKLLRAIAELNGRPAGTSSSLPPLGVTPAPTPASAPPPISASVETTGERRHVTVMFSDLVGSTALSAQMDPEDLREVISSYQKSVAETVSRFGGFVAKYMGDGVLVYFGYPQAHEDDAERAVRAGLELVEGVAALKTRAPLQTRVGIATGLVVVGDLIGTGSAQEQAVVGETPNLAARLQGIAEPNTVVIADSTRKLLGNLFELEDLGAKDLKGIEGPAHAWAALRASSVESRFEALRTTTTPLVGRDEEMELLMRRWAQAKAGDGCVVLISGEPGIGKSRIAEAMQERLGAEPHTRLRFFCSPYHQDSALYPAIAQLERAAGFRREHTPEQRLAKLEAVLVQATNDLSEVAPLIADLLSIPTGERYPALSFTPQKRKEKTLQALVAQADGLAVQQPVLMIFEDVHWSDPTTRELLDLLIERVPAVRLLVVITFRPEFSPPWVGRPQVTLLTLNRLPPRQRIEMISRMIGGKALPREIADQIVERTDGVPLFIEELTKSVLESGLVTEAGDRYAVAGPAGPLAIPTTLHASLLARLDRLAPTREAAQIGAALGRSFSHELISAVAQMSPQKLDDALEQLVRAELIFRRGTPPDAEYTFKHALVQDTAYSTLLRGSRQQLHARVAATLERRFPETIVAEPSLLAQHFTEAGLTEKAISYWLKAGQQSISRCAMNEAVAQLRKGLNLLSSITEGAARQEQELDLQITLGHALMAAKGLAAPEPGEALARARYLCELLAQPQQLGMVLRGQFLFGVVRGELDQAERHAEEMLHLGEARNDAMWACFGSLSIGNTRHFTGKLVDARAYLENALSLCDPTFRRFSPSPEDTYVQILIFLSRTLLYLGYVDQARLRRDEALAEARRLSPYNLVFALCFAWYGDWASEGVESAPARLQSAEKVLAISAEQGFAMWSPVGNIMRGWSLGVVGQAAEGIPLMLKGIDDVSATGCNILIPLFLMVLAQVYGTAGQPEEGLKRLAKAAKLVETTRERWAEAEMHRLRGTLLLSMHDQAAAEDSFHKALAVAQRQNAKFWELRAAMSMARLWRDQGKREAARDLLAPVYGWFTEGFDTRDLKEAKALLGELAS
jgi:class 3 adenylate cyclase/predicted ATPase